MRNNLENIQQKAQEDLLQFLQVIEDSLPSLEDDWRDEREIEYSNELPYRTNITDIEQWEKESLKDENFIEFNDIDEGISELANTIETLQHNLLSSQVTELHSVVPVFLELISGLATDYEYDYFPVNFEDAEENLRLFTIKNDKTIYTLERPNLISPVLVAPISNELFALLVREPTLLYKISPRKFEEIIAEVFYRNGFEVELTKATRDGGKDIVAFTNKMGVRTKYIVECKRYSETNKVSLGLVQRLLGVKMAESANKAILATTSSFTRDAKVFAKNHVWDLDLKDFNDILYWIKSSTLIRDNRAVFCL